MLEKEFGFHFLFILEFIIFLFCLLIPLFKELVTNNEQLLIEPEIQINKKEELEGILSGLRQELEENVKKIGDLEKRRTRGWA